MQLFKKIDNALKRSNPFKYLIMEALKSARLFYLSRIYRNGHSFAAIASGYCSPICENFVAVRDLNDYRERTGLPVKD